MKDCEHDAFIVDTANKINVSQIDELIKKILNHSLELWMGNLLMLSKMWIKLAVRKNMHNTDFDPKIYVYYVQMQAASSLEITTLFCPLFWKAVIHFAFLQADQLQVYVRKG